MAALTSITVTCPVCSAPVMCSTSAVITWHDGSGTEVPVEVTVDPAPLSVHLLDCMAPNLGGDDLVARLDRAASRLEALGHSEGLHDDLRTAITRIRLAETSAHWALGRRDLLRPPTTTTEATH